jgi:KipI family sensor histidine kinase inhibitor
MSDFAIEPLGDSCLSVRFPAAIDPEVNARCIDIASAIRSSGLPGIRDVVPGYHTVAVYFDPLRLPRAELAESLQILPRGLTPVPGSDPVIVPVRYGGEDGPDLGAVATYAGCSEADVIDRHSRYEYRVYMLGFLPGFAYMGTVEAGIAMPRLDSPRLRVPAGSVAIAGAQTGVYPCDSPGGWRIIGRTAKPIYSPLDAQPFAFRPGDSVRFVPA